MNNYESIMATLHAIDNEPNFAVRSEADIVTLLRKNLADPEEGLDELGLAEFYAFSLIENYKGNGSWDSYFGSPAMQFTDGRRDERIPVKKIKGDTIAYWSERSRKSKNPVLRARYAGLVWDLQQKICSTRPDFHEYAVPYIENLIKSVTDRVITSFPGSRQKLSRALNLSVSSKNEILKQKAISAVFQFQQTAAIHTGAGTWRVSYDLLVKPGIVKQGDAGYTEVMDCLESWFEKSLHPVDTGIDLASTEAVFEPLMDQYIKEKNVEKLDSLFTKMQEGLDKKLAVCNVAEGMHWLEKLEVYYKKAGYNNKAADIAVRLQEMGPRLIAEMKLISAEQTFPKDQIDHFVEGGAGCTRGSHLPDSSCIFYS